MNPDPAHPESGIADVVAPPPMAASTRFGTLPLLPHQVWTVRSPLLGFEALRQYVLIAVAGEQPFFWLQAIEDPAVSFLLVPAAHFGLEYTGPVASRDTLVMVLLPRRPGEALRAHRQAPLVFDAAQGEFAQTAFEDGDVQGDGRYRPTAPGGVSAALVERLLMIAPVEQAAGAVPPDGAQAA